MSPAPMSCNTSQGGIKKNLLDSSKKQTGPPNSRSKVEMTQNKFPKKKEHPTTRNNPQINKTAEKDTKETRAMHDSSRQAEMAKFRNSVQSSSNMSEIGKNLIKNLEKSMKIIPFSP